MLLSLRIAGYKKLSFPLTQNNGAVAFTIDNMVYVVSGNGTNNVWQYDPLANIWTKKRNFPGLGRSAAIGFSIGSKGYFGTGVYGGSTLSDFWEYDAASDVWSQKTSFSGGARYGAAAFSASGKGYVMGGNASITLVPNGNTFITKDFWQYNPTNDSWVQKVDFPGKPRFYAGAFSIGNMGYVGLGCYQQAIISTLVSRWKDFYEFNTVNETWSQKAPFPGVATPPGTAPVGRWGVAAFAIDSTGYFCLGEGYSCMRTTDGGC